LSADPDEIGDDVLIAGEHEAGNGVRESGGRKLARGSQRESELISGVLVMHVRCGRHVQLSVDDLVAHALNVWHRLQVFGGEAKGGRHGAVLLCGSPSRPVYVRASTVTRRV